MPEAPEGRDSSKASQLSARSQAPVCLTQGSFSIFHIFLSFVLSEVSLLAAGNGKHLILVIFSVFKMNKMGNEFFFLIYQNQSMAYVTAK